MRLVDLDPRWATVGGPDTFIVQPDGTRVPRPERHGIGITFRCPCPHAHENYGERVFVPFTNPLDGGPSYDLTNPQRAYWQREGDTFDTLTLRPSILRIGGCGWHGFVTNGDVTTV